MAKIKTLSILGPTASGKTALSIELAKRLDGEIVSCDSMQLYRGMNIGTATPDMAEQDGIPHHLFDIREPEDPFSAADYAAAAAPVIADIASRGKAVILCGGTGFYLRSVLYDLDFGTVPPNEALRAELSQLDSQTLYQKLCGL